ncbi:MAG: hypothetical protein ACXVDJ_10645, partial [Tumebacillaceae bacterium]
IIGTLLSYLVAATIFVLETGGWNDVHHLREILPIMYLFMLPANVLGCLIGELLYRLLVRWTLKKWIGAVSFLLLGVLFGVFVNIALGVGTEDMFSLLIVSITTAGSLVFYLVRSTKFKKLHHS